LALALLQSRLLRHCFALGLALALADSRSNWRACVCLRNGDSRSIFLRGELESLSLQCTLLQEVDVFLPRLGFEFEGWLIM